MFLILVQILGNAMLSYFHPEISWPLKSCTPSEEFCVEKDPTDSMIQLFGNKCPRPCNITKYSADLEYKDYGFENDGSYLHLEVMYSSSYVTIFEEYPIYDFSGMVGSVAGSLGVCVGFSIFDVLSRIVDKIFGV